MCKYHRDGPVRTAIYCACLFHEPFHMHSTQIRIVFHNTRSGCSQRYPLMILCACSLQLTLPLGSKFWTPTNVADGLNAMTTCAEVIIVYIVSKIRS